jgi:hypothetical protein
MVKCNVESIFMKPCKGRRISCIFRNRFMSTDVQERESVCISPPVHVSFLLTPVCRQHAMLRDCVRAQCCVPVVQHGCTQTGCCSEAICWHETEHCPVTSIAVQFFRFGTWFNYLFQETCKRRFKIALGLLYSVPSWLAATIFVQLRQPHLRALRCVWHFDRVLRCYELRCIEKAACKYR